MKKKMFYSGLAFSLAITGAIATNAIANSGGSTEPYCHLVETPEQLLWMGCDAGRMSLPEAKDYCENLVLHGFNNWRLPSADELATLIDESQVPTIDNNLFDCNAGRYWTSTKAEGWKRFLTHNFRMGAINEAQTYTHNHYVRCVLRY